MKIENGKIAECTEDELYGYYLTRGFDDLMPFEIFKAKCEKYGTKILDLRIIKEETNNDR